MKTKYTVLLLLLFTFLVSCENGIDTAELDAVPSNVYLAASGYLSYSILDMGESTKDYELYVDKGGYVDREANVDFSYDVTVVEEYLAASSDNLTLLPASVASFEKERVSIGKEETISKNVLRIDLNQLRSLIAENPEANYVYPVRISISQTDESVMVNKAKDYVLLRMQLLKPYAYLKNNGELIENSFDLFRKPNQTDLSVPMEIFLPFENSSYTFSFEIKSDPKLVDEYNTDHATTYEMLPNGVYTLPTMKMSAGESRSIGNIRINLSALPKLIGGKTYLLPVQALSSGNEMIPMEDHSTFYIKVKLAAKWSGSWKNTIHSGESGLATTSGTTYDTYLYSRADALALFTDETILAAFEKITDEEAILCPGWSGTMFEQCSPIIKITDKEAGNGKKVVEILAGWAREGAGWEPATMSNNKSTYDPAKNEIYLDYTGEFSWSSYHIQRTYSGQVPFE